MIGNITRFWRLTREVDIGALRSEFERPASLGVIGSSLAAAERVARLINPASPTDVGAIGSIGGKLGGDIGDM